MVLIPVSEKSIIMIIISYMLLHRFVLVVLIELTGILVKLFLFSLVCIIVTFVLLFRRSRRGDELCNVMA